MVCKACVGGLKNGYSYLYLGVLINIYHLDFIKLRNYKASIHSFTHLAICSFNNV